MPCSQERADLSSDVDALQRDGSVVFQCASEQQARERRAAIRRKCRAAQLKVRTGSRTLTPGSCGPFTSTMW